MPTAAARAGDLSAYGVNIYDPLTGVPAQRQQFAGNVIPASRLSPQAQEILALIPLPERAGARQRDPRQLRRVRLGEVQRGLVQRPRRRPARQRREHVRALQPRQVPARRTDGARCRRRARARQPRRRLGRQEPEPRLRPRLRVLALAAGRLPVRLLPLQRQRAPVRLRHVAGSRRGDSRPEPGQHVHVRSAGRRRRSQRRSRVHLRIEPRRQPLQLPARAG